MRQECSADVITIPQVEQQPFAPSAICGTPSIRLIAASSHPDIIQGLLTISAYARNLLAFSASRLSPCVPMARFRRVNPMR